MIWAQIFKWAAVVISAILGVLTAGNAASVGINTATGGDASGLTTVAGTGVGAALFAFLSWLPHLLNIGGTPGPVDPNNPNKGLPLEILDVVNAAWALLQHKGDSAYVKALIVQCLEAGYAFVVAKFGTQPEVVAMFKQLFAWIEEQFSLEAQAAPQRLSGPRPDATKVLPLEVIQAAPTATELVLK